VEKTIGAALFKTGIDTMAFDVNTLSRLGYGSGTNRIEDPSGEDFATQMQSIIYGTGATADIEIPVLGAVGDYTFLTVSKIATSGGGKKLGVGLKTLYVENEYLHVQLHSPARLLIEDGDGNKLGYDSATDEYVSEIPGGYIIDQINPGDSPDINPGDSHDEYIIYELDDRNEYTYTVTGDSTVAPEDDTYSLTITQKKGDETEVVEATDLEISDDESHQFVPDWDKVEADEDDSVTVKIDEDGDGTYETETVGGTEVTDSDISAAKGEIPMLYIGLIVIILLVVVGVAVGLSKRGKKPPMQELLVLLLGVVLLAACVPAPMASGETLIGGEDERSEIGYAAVMGAAFGMVLADAAWNSDMTLEDIQDMYMIYMATSIVIPAILYVSVSGMVTETESTPHLALMSQETADGHNWTIAMTGFTQDIWLSDVYVEMVDGYGNYIDSINWLDDYTTQVVSHGGGITFNKGEYDDMLMASQSFFINGWELPTSGSGYELKLIYYPTGDVIASEWLEGGEIHGDESDLAWIDYDPYEIENGTTSDVTVWVYDDYDSPLAGIWVTLNGSGVSPDSGYTDSFGEITFYGVTPFLQPGASNDAIVVHAENEATGTTVWDFIDVYDAGQSGPSPTVEMMAVGTGDGNWTVGLTSVTGYIDLAEIWVELDDQVLVGNEDGLHVINSSNMVEESDVGMFTFHNDMMDPSLALGQYFSVYSYDPSGGPGAQSGWRFTIYYHTGEVIATTTLP
jgi:hypothetical protein